MKRYTYALLLLFSLIFKLVEGQVKTLVNIRFKDTKVHIVNIEKALGNEFYQNDMPILKKSTDFQTLFEGEITYPYFVNLLIDSTFRCAPIVLYPGINELDVVPYDGGFALFRKDNYQQDDTYAKYQQLFPYSYDIYRYLSNNKIGTDYQRDSLLTLSYNTTDTILKMFVTENPRSYLALYKLAQLLPFGYKSLFFDIYNSLDTNVRSSEVGNIVGLKLNKMRKFDNGQQFPAIVLPNEVGRQLDLMTTIKSAKYTLIDFWYSNCGPCIAQFPILKTLYKEFHEQGFSIAGVSTDADRQLWISAIKTNGIPWINLWDSEKKNADLLNLTAYPSNFLVDTEGKIVKTNISPTSLKIFLEKKLK